MSYGLKSRPPLMVARYHVVMPIMIIFKSTKKAVVALIVAPWLAIPSMTIIDMLSILARNGNYSTTETGEIELFFTNLFLYSIVYTPVSYLITFILFLPAIYLLHIKSSINLVRAMLIGMGIGFITPSLIKSALYLLQESSEHKVSFVYILPNLSNIESAEPYMISTTCGVIVVLGLWFIGGITSHPSGR